MDEQCRSGAATGLAVGADDADLVSAAQRGSTPAFARLVERHYPPLLRSLTRQVGDPDLAADLAQDVFMDAQRTLGRVTADRPFAAWLYGIARNHVRRAWRARLLRRVCSLDQWRSLHGDDAAALQRPDGCAACHERDLLQRAADRLSPALRETLVLHGLWGFTTKEIADALGITPAAAGRRISRANEQFRQQYEAITRGHNEA